jgi:hypothetical protein
VSLKSFYDKISKWVHGAEVEVSDAFVAVVGKQAAEQFAQGALALLKTAEGKIVADAVAAVQTLATDGAGKRAAAFEKIGADFKTQGISVGGSLLNMLIEIAVQALEGGFLPA